MDNELQDIQGASLLSSLINLFFKGVDKALSDAAQYEEEYGVLKQINKLQIADKDGKEHTLIVKLSPVKNKDNLYYVEVDGSDVPNLNVESLDQKTIKLDKSNLDNFKKVIKNFLQKSGYIWIDDDADSSTDNTDADDTSEETDTDSNEENTDNPDEADTSELLDVVKDRLAHQLVLGSIEGKGLIAVNREIEDETNSGFNLIIYGTAAVGDKRDVGLKDLKKEILLLHDNNEIRTFEDVWQDITDATDKYIKDNNIENMQYMRASSQIEIKVLKNSESGKTELKAINASTDVKASLQIVGDILSDQEFNNSLEDDTEYCFAIDDLGDSYNVTTIEGFNEARLYCDLFNYCSKAFSYLQTLNWAIGSDNWFKSSSYSEFKYRLAELLDVVAVWNVRNIGTYPVQTPWTNQFVCSADIIGEEKQLTVDDIKEPIRELMADLIENLDCIKIGLLDDEQIYISEFIGSVRTTLAYL